MSRGKGTATTKARRDTEDRCEGVDLVDKRRCTLEATEDRMVESVPYRLCAGHAAAVDLMEKRRRLHRLGLGDL